MDQNDKIDEKVEKVRKSGFRNEMVICRIHAMHRVSLLSIY